MSGLSPAEIIGRILRRAKYIAEQESQCSGDTRYCDVAKGRPATTEKKKEKQRV